MSKSFPKEIFVYVADTLDDGTPIYGVATDINDIMEDSAGEKIGIYSLNRRATFLVRRELK